MVRHFFPQYDLREIEDEEFAMLASEAEWLFYKQAQMNMMGGLQGMPTGGGNNRKPQLNRPAPRKR